MMGEGAIDATLQNLLINTPYIRKMYKSIRKRKGRIYKMLS
jgi:hypothetical protein